MSSALDYFTGGVNPFGDIRDISTVFPRHVGSRVMVTDEGSVVWRPSSDIWLTDDDIIAHIDLPGVSKEEIHIDADQDQVVIHGHHKGNKPFEAASSRVRERNIGRFRKIISLPAGVDLENIEAKYENGMLEVKIPKGKFMEKKMISID